MRRRNRYGYRRPTRWPLVVTGALAAIVVAAVVWVFAPIVSKDDAPEAAPSGSASESPWPVETQTPPADVTAGDGTFRDPAEVDRANPDAVAEATAELFGSHDTLLDSSEAESRDRAAPLLTPELLELPRVETPSPGWQWLEAQKHEAYSEPQVGALNVPALGHSHEGETEEEHAAHADEAANIGMPTVTASGEPALGYQFDVVYHWVGRDGWVPENSEGIVREVRLALVERDGQWVVAEAFYGSPQVTGSGVK
jgi:hypothetical protein